MLSIFKETQALLDGHFKLTSGRHSDSYFQCAKVLQHPEHLGTICSAIADHFRESGVDTVISPAIGGIVVGTEVGRQLGVKTIFAERKDGRMTIRRGFSLEKNERVLVVEDVITTGGSVAEVMALVEAAGAEVAASAAWSTEATALSGLPTLNSPSSRLRYTAGRPNPARSAVTACPLRPPEAGPPAPPPLHEHPPAHQTVSFIGLGLIGMSLLRH